MNRYIMIVLTAIIACLPAAVAAKNPFKEGNRLYMQGEYAGALEQYNAFIQKEPDRFEGYYNAGNSLFRQEEYEQALGMYKKALELKKDDEDTKANIAATEKKLKEKPRDKDKKQDRDKKQDQKQGQDKQQGKDGSQNKQQDKQDPKQGSKDKQEQQGSKGKERQDGNADKQQSQQQEAGKSEQESEAQKAAKLPQGMTEDQVQALLNQLQNQEQNLRQRGYFSQQPQDKSAQQQQQVPDIFNMSPQEIQRYMMKKMFDPDYELPQQKSNGSGNEKDW
ncbi:MAG: tetratricopeptide repeat protein [Spirochaetia bacterium]|nr:tetratricopeptide repeat protein [Spirochaetia bacterium]